MNVDRYTTYPDRRVAAQSAVGAFLARSCSRFLRKYLPTSMEELAALTPHLYGSSAELLTDADWFPSAELTEFRAEYDALQAELASRYETHSLTFPLNWAVETGTSFLLYALIRGLRPEAVIEIGVANGHSAYFMLNALRANGTGTLHSFDVFSGAGGLLSDAERAAWQFHLVSQKRSGQDLREQIAKMPKAGLCFHDADHSYLGQHAEFVQCWEQLAEDGVLVGDDVDASYAWLDFCRSLGRESAMLVDARKAVGVLRRSAPAAPA
jgi:predicted O-methyltransferase YrrM